MLHPCLCTLWYMYYYYSTTLLTTCAHTVVLQNQLGCSETSIVFGACFFDQDCSLSSCTHTRRLY
jgi:hypothetical protein